MKLVSHSVAETHQLAKKIAKTLKRGDVILLQANLGAGKTTFVQGLVRTLGFRESVISPTFVIAHTYETKIPVHHLDFYRLTKKEILDMGLQDYFLGEGEIEPGIVVVEWAERCRELWPKKRIEITMRIKRGSTDRLITLRRKP